LDEMRGVRAHPGEHRLVFSPPTAFCAGRGLTSSSRSGTQEWEPADKELGPPPRPSPPPRPAWPSPAHPDETPQSVAAGFETALNEGSPQWSIPMTTEKLEQHRRRRCSNASRAKARYLTSGFPRRQSGRLSPWLQGVQLNIIKEASRAPQEENNDKKIVSRRPGQLHHAHLLPYWRRKERLEQMSPIAKRLASPR